MKRHAFYIYLLLAIGGVVFEISAQDMNPNASLDAGTYARFDTTKGKILIDLFEDRRPETVKNFAALAEGRMQFVDPRTGQKTRREFYDNLIIHHVNPGMYIQGGSPLGRGSSEITFPNPNEGEPDAQIQPGSLLMYQRKPDTGSSQFILAAGRLEWLDGMYPIFGQTISGLDVIDKISRVEADAKKQPLQPVVLKNVEILRVTDEEPMTVKEALAYGTEAKAPAPPTAVVTPEPTPHIKDAPDVDPQVLRDHYKRINPQVIDRQSWMGTPKETLLSPRERRVYREAMWKEKIAELQKQRMEQQQAEEQQEEAQSGEMDDASESETLSGDEGTSP